MKTALITGASSEIGISISKRLEKKYNLILIKHEKDINLSNFENKPLIYNCDFNNENSVKELIGKLKNTKIDLLVNIAAYDQNNLIENITVEDIICHMKINTIAPFLLMKELFKKHDQGLVINIGSTDGIDTYNEYNLPYATSKAALIHITKQLKLCYNNLKLYVLCPNYINTNTVRNMETKFLEEELKRIKQNKLIEIEEVTDKIEEIIETLPNEIIIRME